MWKKHTNISIQLSIHLLLSWLFLYRWILKESLNIMLFYLQKFHLIKSNINSNDCPFPISRYFRFTRKTLLKMYDKSDDMSFPFTTILFFRSLMFPLHHLTMFIKLNSFAYPCLCLIFKYRFHRCRHWFCNQSIIIDMVIIKNC